MTMQINFTADQMRRYCQDNIQKIIESQFNEINALLEEASKGIKRYICTDIDLQNEIVDALHKDGFKVDYDEAKNEFEISW